jgi:23S rRNA (adenine2503-C2)-methyltransferase
MPAHSESPVPDAILQLSFFDQTFDSFSKALRSWGWAAFRAGQIFDWVYHKGIAEAEQMTNLSKRDREFLNERVIFATATVAREQHSTDGTIKLLLTWPDGKTAETVMIPDADRRTACVSSQVGCPAGCRFCASGINGVQGNLSAGQIVEQIWTLNRILAGSGGGGSAAACGTAVGTAVGAASAADFDHIGNVVFMGMGEPLANYSNVIKALRILHEPKGLNIGARRMTVSTVGVAPKIRQLANEGMQFNLALSLHAPNESLRKELIPWAEHFSLPEIMDACRYYFDKTSREITMEYILLAGVNDRPQHARELAKLCKTIRANVNLIRYNEVDGLPYGRPKSEDVVKFQEILRNAGINAHVRKSRGRDIDAACGQLRRRQEQTNPGGVALTVL